ncbi:hypothetical protein VTN02DRAFT_3838 [Thermoascus thermophilus]
MEFIAFQGTGHWAFLADGAKPRWLRIDDGLSLGAQGLDAKLGASKTKKAMSESIQESAGGYGYPRQPDDVCHAHTLQFTFAEGFDWPSTLPGVLERYCGRHSRMLACRSIRLLQLAYPGHASQAGLRRE